MLIAVILIMAAIQISVWQLFPKKIKHMIFANPIVAFLVNLAGSGLIAAFTGAASFVGIANLGASVLFGVYAFTYSKRLGIKGVGFSSYKLWTIPICPKPVVCYELGGKSWRE